MSAPSYWQRHGGWDLFVNDADVVPSNVTASIYSAGRAHPNSPLPFAVCLSVRCNPASVDCSLSPQAARKIAAALIAAADDCDVQLARTAEKVAA